MSRTVHLDLTEDKVEALCRKHSIGVSALEVLPSGGVRLVCSSGAGAETIRTALKSKLIKGDVVRTAHRPRTGNW